LARNRGPAGKKQLAVNKTELIKVLLIEDDEDDYFLTKGFLKEIKGQQFEVDWANTHQQGLQKLLEQQHDICLVDYRLGARNGIDLLRAAAGHGCKAPIILLTGQGEHEIDLEAMKAGAADYLVKGRLDAVLLDRSIRYALERHRAAARAAKEQARLAAFGADIGLALTRNDSLESILQHCAQTMAYYLDMALARIWIFDAHETSFKIVSSAGPASSPDPKRQQLKIHLDPVELASGKPLFIQPLRGNMLVCDPEWVERERLVAYAGYPLILENRLVGLVSLFSQVELKEAIFQEMASVANGIALCIERKRSAEALDASEFKYRSVVENIKEVIFQVDGHCALAFLNPAWTGITGHKVKESLGTSILDYIHPEDRDRHSDLFQLLIQRRQSYFHDETRYLAADGSFRWVEVYAQPILDEDALGASGTIRDITERKQAEDKIQRLAAFVQLNPNPVMELSSDGAVTYLNSAAEAMAQSLNRTDAKAILPPSAAILAQECLRVGASKLNQEIQIQGRTLSWSFFPITTSHVVHCYGMDITERIDLEAQLRHSQKLESIGQLAAGVAHDFNNILTIIQGHTDRMIVQTPGHELFFDPLNQVSLAAQRAASLTRQLLMFSRKQVIQPRTIDINAVLGNMAKMLHRLLGENISHESRLSQDLPAVEGDIGMIEQVIMNLSVNARDAMPKGGQLLISTLAVEISESYLAQHPDARKGLFACLSVTDTGCGMAPETLTRIFEPFFTTKEVGKGTGLGLATVYGIVKQHQGWVEVSSQLNVGTTFKIYLPASSKQVEQPVAPIKPTRSVKGGTETILLVEDEPLLRELAHAILKDYDYTVLEAESGVEALKVWDAHKGKIDLLLTDMVMPEGIGGRELAETLKALKPDLKIIFTSGYSSDIMGSEPGTAEVRFLQKPYPPPQLAQTVRECLDIGV
jgi:two-component system, cell cycle sensor histidine kinase and response regulator CckA